MSKGKEEAREKYQDANKLYDAEIYDEALTCYQEAAELDLTFIDAHFCVAKTQVRLQSYEKGIEYFRKHINLISEEDRAMYSVGLAGILLEEGQHEKALELVKEQGQNVTGKQLQTYLKILLANGEINRVFLQLLNVSQERASEWYQEIVNDQSIEKAHRKKLQQEYAIPEYHDTADKAALLSNAPVENTTYSEKIDGVLTYINQGKEDFGDSLQQHIDTLNNKITDLQHLLGDCVQDNIDQQNTSQAETQLEILEKTDYGPVKIQSLCSSLAAVKKQKRNTYFKYGAIAVLAVLLLFGGIQGYGYLSDSWAWSEAKEADTYNAYREYIVTYPDGNHLEEARKSAEINLWEEAKKDSVKEKLEAYLDKYPVGEFSRQARDILNAQARNSQRSSAKQNGTLNARVIGTDVIIRSDHTTESEVAGVIEEYGEEVKILDEYYPQNTGEAILSDEITIYENGNAIDLNEGKAVSILSSNGEQVRVSFAHADYGKVTTTIDRDNLEGIGGEKWYKVQTTDNTTGWIYGKFIEEL